MWFRWDDFDQGLGLMEDVRQRLERVLDDYDVERRTGVGGRNSWPAVGLADRGETLELRADVPGVSEKDLNVTLNNDTLTLSGERRAEVPEGYRVHRQERLGYKFARSYTLPCKVSADRIKANLKDGVLTVTLEKAPESQPRSITVSAS